MAAKRFLARKLELIITIAMLLWISVANAGPSPALKVVIDGLDTDAARCGLDADSVFSQATLTLRANGIRVIETITNPYLYINLNVLLVGQQVCVVNIAVSVKGYTQEDMAIRAPKETA